MKSDPYANLPVMAPVDAAVGPGGWVVTAGVADAVGAAEAVDDAVGLGLAATWSLPRSWKLAMSAMTSTAAIAA